MLVILDDGAAGPRKYAPPRDMMVMTDHFGRSDGAIRQ